MPCNHGNFLEEVKSRALYDPVLEAHLSKCIAESERRRKGNPTSKGRGSLVTFLSATTFSKMLNIISSMILEIIKERILANGGRFSISLDGCQDISVKEQLSLVARYVDEFGPVEVLLDITAATDTSGEAICNYILKTLKTLQLDVNDLCGYSFDSAGNMAGCRIGVQARLKEIVPDSVFQHCYAHVLNLILQKSCNMIPQASSLFNLLRNSATSLSESYKRMNMWKDITSILYPNMNTRLMVKFGKTRWWAKAKACSRIFEVNNSLLPIIIPILEMVSKDTSLNGTVRSKLSGEVRGFCAFETVAVGILFQKIFTAAGPVSDYLQTVQLDHVQASRLTSNLIPTIEKIDVEEVLKEAKTLAEKINTQIDQLNSTQTYTQKYGLISARVKTQCPDKRIPVVATRLGERANDEMRQVASQQSSNYPLKVNALIPILDYCLQGLRERFGDTAESLPIFKSCSLLNPENFEEIVKRKDGIPEGSLDHLCRLARVDPSDVCKELLTFAAAYPDLMKNVQADCRPTTDLSKFDVDLQDVPLNDGDYDDDDIDDPDPIDLNLGTENENADGGESENSEARPSQSQSSRKFKCEEAVACRGCLRCPYRILRKHGLFTSAFSNLCAVYKIALTLPCTQVSCERCFSKLKIIKSRLRNTMADDYLRSSMLIAIERELAASLKPEDILEKYASSSVELRRLLMY